MKRYVVTTAQACASPHSYLLRGIKCYAARNKAEIIVLPTIGKSAREDWDEIHPVFKSYLEYGKRKLNSNIVIEQFNVRPYQIDPVTGLSRFAQQEQSAIFASPKQRLQTISHAHSRYPKFLMTTGACTRPNYASGKDSSAERRRLGNIARRDHVYGFVVVEVVDDSVYHFRHVRANHKGEFCDLGKKYSGNKITTASVEAMVCGDWHNGQGIESVYEATYKMIEEFKPKRLVLHDFFDAHSVSHHIEKKPVREKLIQIYDKGLHLLEKELREANEVLQKLSRLMSHKTILLVHSNHHVFLHRYLEEGRFTKDSHNFRVAVELLGYMAEKDYNNPVEAGIKKYGRLASTIRFLLEDNNVKVRGYQLAQHGDHNWATNGYSSLQANEINYGKCISGHVHGAQMLRNTYTVGTCLPLNMFYMRGFPTKWTHTHALIYSTGTVQLINIIGGRYKDGS